jgi:hypothetical protein
VVSLKGEGISSAILDLSPLANLKLLFLIDNSMYGTVPPSIGELYELYRLNL